MKYAESTHTIRGVDLFILWGHAARRDKEPIYEIRFKNGMRAIVTLEYRP